MFVAFMLLYILLCDEVLPYFVLRVEVIRSLNLNKKDLNLYEVQVKVNPLTQLTQSGLRNKAQPNSG
jgi:hypothetical protein